MADGDEIHPALSLRFLNSYKQMAQGRFNHEEVTSTALKAVRNQAKANKNGILEMLVDIAAGLGYIPKEPLLNIDTDWQACSSLIDQISRTAAGSPRAIAMAVDACKKELIDLQHGDSNGDMLKNVVFNYYERIYQAEFEERVPLIGDLEHYEGASSQFIDQQLETIRPLVKEGLMDLADQACRYKDVTKVKIYNDKPVPSLYEDLESIFA